MCVFVSRPMKIATFLRKNGETPKLVVDFPRSRDTFRNKTMEIVKDFECETKFLRFFHCSSFSVIFQVFFLFSISSFFFIFLHCSSFLVWARGGIRLQMSSPKHTAQTVAWKLFACQLQLQTSSNSTHSVWPTAVPAVISHSPHSRTRRSVFLLRCSGHSPF